MNSIDLTPVGKHLSSSDNLNDLEGFLSEEDEFTKFAMNSAFSVLYGRVGETLDIEKDVYSQLSNINKFYLVRGAYPEREQELRAFILERFYKAAS